MPAELQMPQRIAWIVGGILVAAGIGFLIFVVPRSRDWKGMGFSLLMDKQAELRRDLIHEGTHLNELEVWQIQDELARRTKLSRDGVKGLILRAVNAKEPWLRIEALLLSGNPEDAAPEAANLLKQSASLTPEATARAYRVQADAVWRQPAADTTTTPGDLFTQALKALGNAAPALRTDLLLDLSSYHWSVANFRPEKPREPLEQTIRAAGEAAQLLEKGLTNTTTTGHLDLAAALRLQGNAYLRLGVLPSETMPDAGLKDPAALAKATDLLIRASKLVPKPNQPDLWAGIQHDLGVAFTERAAAEQMNRDHLAAALAAFDEALAIRGGKVADGRADVRQLEQRLTARAETQAFRSQALALIGTAMGKDAAGAQFSEDALIAAKAALELTTSKDPGPAWVVAQRSQALAEAAISNALPNTTEAGLHMAESIDASVAALKDYPLEMEDSPGVPSRRMILLNLAATCQDARARRDMPGLALKLQEVENIVRPMIEKLDRTPYVETFRAASAALGSALALRAELLTDPAQRKPLLDETDALLLRATAARQETQTNGSPTQEDVRASQFKNPWRIPWPQDRIMSIQLDRAAALLDQLGTPAPLALPPASDTPKRP